MRDPHPAPLWCEVQAEVHRLPVPLHLAIGKVRPGLLVIAIDRPRPLCDRVCPRAIVILADQIHQVDGDRALRQTIQPEVIPVCLPVPPVLVRLAGHRALQVRGRDRFDFPSLPASNPVDTVIAANNKPSIALHHTLYASGPRDGCILVPITGRTDMGEYYEKGDKRGPAIPYPKITGLLFNGPSNRTQSLIPFLGAGASLGRRPVWKEPDVVYPGADELERIISGLHLSGTARQFMELAVRLAAKIQALQKADESGRARPNPLALAQDAKYPPSASELAAALAFQSQYDGFERPRQRLGAVLSADDEHLAALLRWIADLTEWALRCRPCSRWPAITNTPSSVPACGMT